MPKNYRIFSVIFRHRVHKVTKVHKVCKVNGVREVHKVIGILRTVFAGSLYCRRQSACKVKDFIDLRPYELYRLNGVAATGGLRRRASALGCR